jgi:Rab GDP dissociation inhibitor
MVSFTHNVCAKEVYLAIVSTVVETDVPEREIIPGLQLLGPIHEKYEAYPPEFCDLHFAPRFVSVSSIYTPIADGKLDNIFITRSYDATSHFETVVDDVHDVWKRIVGTDLVLKKQEVEVKE